MGPVRGLRAATGGDPRKSPTGGAALRLRPRGRQQHDRGAVSRLRKKLGADAIETIRGLGYGWAVHEGAAQPAGAAGDRALGRARRDLGGGGGHGLRGSAPRDGRGVRQRHPGNRPADPAARGDGDHRPRSSRSPAHRLRAAPRRTPTYVVRDETGAVVLASHDADPASSRPRRPPGFSSTATHRIYAERRSKVRSRSCSRNPGPFGATRRRRRPEPWHYRSPCWSPCPSAVSSWWSDGGCGRSGSSAPTSRRAVAATSPRSPQGRCRARSCRSPPPSTT